MLVKSGFHSLYLVKKLIMEDWISSILCSVYDDDEDDDDEVILLLEDGDEEDDDSP